MVVFINPIRNVTQTTALGYDATSKEITYYTPTAANPTITDTNTDATYYPTFVAGSGTQELLADIKG